MASHTIKFCENNFAQGTEETVNRLRSEVEDVEVVVEFCLGQCGTCADKPFAMVDDELITADSADELYEALLSSLV